MKENSLRMIVSSPENNTFGVVDNNIHSSELFLHKLGAVAETQVKPIALSCPHKNVHICTYLVCFDFASQTRCQNMRYGSLIVLIVLVRTLYLIDPDYLISC